MSQASQDKPPYIHRDGGMMFAPPYLQADTFLAGWVVPSSKQAQQHLLDRTVNRALAGRAIRYQAVWPRLMLSFADIRRVSSVPQQEQGYVTERDVTLWFLASVHEGDTLKRMVWFLPYIWVDNPLAVVVGREVFGFPKQLASMKIPAHPREPGPFVADTPVLASFGRQSEARPGRLLEVRASGLERTGAEEVEINPEQPDRLASFFPGEPAAPGQAAAIEEGVLASAGNLVGQLAASLRRRSMPILFLKQFPDATVPDRACYQRVVEAPASIKSLDKLGILPGSWTAQFHSHASHQLHETLAIPTGPLELGRGFYLQYSFTMDMGVEIG